MRSVYLTTLFQDRLSPLSGKPVLVHILSPETDNCSSLNSGRERMTVENSSCSISTKQCCQSRRGSKPQLVITSRTRIRLSLRGRLEIGLVILYTSTTETAVPDKTLHNTTNTQVQVGLRSGSLNGGLSTV